MKELIDISRKVLYLCPESLGESADKSLENEIDDKDSILSESETIAQQDSVCGELGLPTTILIPREGRIERIDSKVAGIALRPSCDMLRRCAVNGLDICKDCDANHAELLRDLPEHGAVEDLLLRIDGHRSKWQKMGGYWEGIYDSPKHNINAQSRGKYVFLSYNCPMLGYRELMFPIFFEGKVVAVFVVGQIKIDFRENDENKGAIETTKQMFFEKIRDKGLFNDYIEKYKNEKEEELSEEEILNVIMEKGVREGSPEYPDLNNLGVGIVNPESKDILTEGEYEELIGKVCSWIDKLEIFMRRQMSHKRELWVRENVSIVMDKFHAEAAVNIKWNKNDVFNTFWKAVQNLVDALTKYCGLSSFVVFGVTDANNREVNVLRPAVYSGDVEERNLQLNLSRGKRQPLTLDSHILFVSESEKTETDYGTLFDHITKWLPAASIGMLVKFRSKTMEESITTALEAALKNVSSTLSSWVLACFEFVSQTTLQRTLRYYKHEISNLNVSISHAIERYLGHPKIKIDGVNKSRIDTAYKAASDSLKTFEFMSEGAMHLVDEPKTPRPVSVNFHRDLVQKWANNKEPEAKSKGCDIETHSQGLSNIYIDINYAEQIVYNLLVNAVKYSYEGTRITVNYSLKPGTEKRALTVTNFSFGLSSAEQKSIFYSGVRTVKSELFNPEGSGIGLWIVDKVAAVLGGSVELLEPELISEYHVPLLNAAMQNPYRYLGKAKIPLTKAMYEGKRLKEVFRTDSFGNNVSLMDLVLSKHNRKKFREHEIIAEINEPTYMITFEVIFQ